MFAFPDGTTIGSGENIAISCIGSENNSSDFVWDEKTVLSKKKEDSAVLCDPFGNIVHSLPAE